MTMGLQLRNGVWYVRVQNKVTGEDRRFSTGTSIKREARTHEQRILAELRDATARALRPRTPTLGDLFDFAVTVHYRGKSSERTVGFHRAAIASAIEGVMARPGDSLTADDYATIVAAQREKGNADVTIGKVFQTLGKVLSLAQGKGKIATFVPVLTFERPKKGRIRVYDDVEEAEIVAEFRRIYRPMAALTTALIETGMRLGEVIARDRLQHDRDALTVELWDTKNGEGRTIPLSPEADAALAEWLSQPAHTKDQIESRWQTMRRNIGRDGDDQFVIHALRHTCCTRLLRGGMHPFEVMKWMGHKDIKSTLRYSHLVTEDIRKGASILAKRRVEATAG